jgi:hypothetical protein
MISYGTKSVCVVDNGLFSELARTLASSFGKSFYTSPWVADYPTSYHTELGEGFPNFERVNDIWEIVDDVDLFVFTDLHQGPLQEYLASQGKRVWGSRNGEELEVERVQAKAHFETLGIPQPPYEVVKGMTALRKYIKSRDKEKLWIKISRTRGDTETFCVQGYDLCKNRLDDLQAEWGPVAEDREFIVEDDLPDTLDLAIDTYCIDGKYPTKALLGTEQKDEGYIGAVKEWKSLPPNLVDIYDKLSGTLKDYQYRNFLSLESRVQKKDIWLGDPCTRCGSPPFELELNMLKNLAEILWEGADGKLVEPEYDGKFGFEMLVQSSWVDDRPLLVEFPEKYRDQIKFRYATQFADGLWIMPQKAGPHFAAIVTCGNSMEDCFAEAEQIGREIKGTKVDAFVGSMDGLRKNLGEFAKWGIKFDSGGTHE